MTENRSVEFEVQGQSVFMTIWHDKGKSVYIGANGAWIPVDPDSQLAMEDFMGDLFRGS
jgi:malate synthase